MKVLNLYAGIGGNRKLWKDVKVTAIEFDNRIAEAYKELHPSDELIICDAHEYLLKHANEYDFIWSSPPCPTHSRMMKATRHDVKAYPDMSLYQEIIYLQHFFKGKWVVENVKPYYEPLIQPTAKLGRHYFWSNFEISDFEMKNHKGFISTGTIKVAQEMKDWLGLNYTGNIYYKGNHCPGQVLRNCVHPEMGKHIFDCALNIKKPLEVQNQPQLF